MDHHTHERNARSQALIESVMALNLTSEEQVKISCKLRTDHAQGFIDLSARSPKDLMTALDWAAYHGYENILDTMCDIIKIDKQISHETAEKILIDAADTAGTTKAQNKLCGTLDSLMGDQGRSNAPFEAAKAPEQTSAKQVKPSSLTSQLNTANQNTSGKAVVYPLALVDAVRNFERGGDEIELVQKCIALIKSGVDITQIEYPSKKSVMDYAAEKNLTMVIITLNNTLVAGPHSTSAKGAEFLSRALDHANSSAKTREMIRGYMNDMHTRIDRANAPPKAQLG